FETVPNITLTEYSQLVTWDVGTPTVHEFWLRMGVASNAEKFCGEGDCPASKVVTNRQKLSELLVLEEDDIFDIVP
ncbi:MAG: hypothetical protein WBF13_06185, partial [Candidatus Zixiibacteriota bacterium]